MNPSLKRLHPRGLLHDAILSGSSASLASAGALAIYSKLETGSAAAGMNGPSQWVWGVRAAKTNRPSLKHTAIGYVIHHGTSIFWALLYERLLGRRARTRRLSALQIAAEAAATAAGAYVVDYKLTPRRFQPGFEQHVSARAMLATYAAFAAGLAVVTMLRRR
jgi:hypothetical protein